MMMNSPSPKARRKTKPAASSSSSSSKTKQHKTWLDLLLVVCLVVVLGHTLSLLHHGHTLIEHEQEAFQAAHKEQFLNAQQQQQVIGGLSTGYRAKTRSDLSYALDTSSVSDVSVKDDTAATTNSKSAATQPVQQQQQQQQQSEAAATQQQQLPPPAAVLNDLKILVAIASYDFSQIPHLEETLDGYHELCVAGAAHVDVKVHTTVVLPVAWLDLWQTRFTCPQFTLTFVIVNHKVRLHLVDLHRQLFYDELPNYDLFIYTEDDMRVTPTTVATYWQTTQQLHALLGQNNNNNHDNDNDDDDEYLRYNVGIVRYEYNFPSVVMDDHTRHATENVTRVYWEHGSYSLAHHQPLIPNAVQAVPGLPSDGGRMWVHMTNHHQGMFLATRAHLQYWDRLPHCRFSQATKRPGLKGKPSQPLLGTQRVWMSSYQLYEPKYCHIQQVLPIHHLGALTVHHLPNKNYRRKKGGRTKLDHDKPTLEPLAEQGDNRLVTALQLHLELRRAWPTVHTSTPPPRDPPTIRIDDRVTRDRTPGLEARLRAFRAYAERGYVLSDQDMHHTELVEEPEEEEEEGLE